MLLGMLSRLSTRDTWLTSNAPGNALSVEHSGHVAHSQCSQRVLSVWAFGTRGVLGRLLDGVSRCGLRAGSEGVPKGFLGRAALVVGLEIDGWDGPAGSDRPIDQVTLAVGSGWDGRDLLWRGFLLQRQGDGKLKVQRWRLTGFLAGDEPGLVGEGWAQLRASIQS